MKNIFNQILLLMFLMGAVNNNGYAQTLTELSQIGGGTTMANDAQNGMLYYAMGQKLVASNVTDPTKPDYIGAYSFNLLIEEIKVDGNYAYVVTRDSIATLNVVDITNPASMLVLSSLEIGELTFDIIDDAPYFSMAIDGNYAYLNTYEAILVVDLTDKTNVKEVGSIPSTGMSLDGAIYASGDYLLAGITDYNDWNSYIVVYDVKDKANIELISKTDSIRGYAEGIAVEGNIAYVVEGDYGMSAHDITDITNPVQLDTTSLSMFWLNDIVVNDGMAYVSLYSGGVFSVDVSDPNNLPEYETGYYFSNMAYSSTYAISIYNNTVFLSSGISGLEFVDISDPSTLTSINVSEYISTGGRSTAAKYKDGILYIANGGSGLLMVDVSIPEEPKPLYFADAPGYAYTVDVAGDFAFLGHSNGLSVFNVADVNNPFFEGEYYDYNGQGRTIYDLKYHNDYLYAAYGKAGLVIFDVSDPKNPTIKSQSFSGYGGFDPQGILFVDEYLYVSDQGDGGGFSDNRGSMSVWDVSNVSNPVLVDREIFGTDDNWNYTTKLAYINGYVVLGDESDSWLFDVSNPDDPVFEKRLFGGCSDVAVSGDYLYIAKASKLLVYDASNPTSMVQKGNFPKQDYGWGVEVGTGSQSDLVFYMDLDAGVHVLRNNLIEVSFYEKEAFEGLTAYPIPVVDVVNVESKSEFVSAELIDNNGRVIRSIKNINANNFSINLSDLGNGIYIMNLRNMNGAFKSIKISK